MLYLPLSLELADNPELLDWFPGSKYNNLVRWWCRFQTAEEHLYLEDKHGQNQKK
jgi:hypothetical protein